VVACGNSEAVCRTQGRPSGLLAVYYADGMHGPRGPVPRGWRDGNPGPDVGGGGVLPEAEKFFLTYILSDVTKP
jgi:hypothetical protein